MLLHQLLVMALAGDGITAEAAWVQLSPVPDFRGIGREEYDRLVQWLLHDGALRLAGGQLVIGPKAEKLFGRRNYMELYAVFSSPETYTVQSAGGHPIGSLSQDFVDRLVDGVSCFLLSGRPWFVMRVQHDDRRVIVDAAPRGREPTWGGYLPQFLGYEVSQKTLAVLTGKQTYPYLDEAAAGALAHERKMLAHVLRAGIGGVEITEKEVRWWTFAGGRINATLRYALEAVGEGWKVVPDNYLIRIRGEGLDRGSLESALEKLSDPGFWEDDELWAGIAASLPTYRLSKFQPLMPGWMEREVVAKYLLDVDGTWQWLETCAR